MKIEVENFAKTSKVTYLFLGNTGDMVDLTDFLKKLAEIHKDDQSTSIIVED